MNTSSRRLIALALLLFAVEAARGEKAPDFTAPKLDGSRFKLSDALAKGPVLIHFWDVCCPGCREALPDIEFLHERFGDSLTVIAVSTDAPKSQAKVKPLIKSKGYHFDVLLDDQMEVRKLFGGTESPLTILVAPTGEIVLRRVGAAPENRQAIADAVRALLLPKPVVDEKK